MRRERKEPQQRISIVGDQFLLGGLKNDLATLTAVTHRARTTTTQSSTLKSLLPLKKNMTVQ